MTIHTDQPTIVIDVPRIAGSDTVKVGVSYIVMLA